jgi:uncharacterized protein YndB with AHSA1/START domain
MSKSAGEALSVVVERDIPFPPQKIWRALTQPHLIEEWLMKNDFKPVVEHRFSLRADWGAVDCQVLEVEPNKTLSYTWAAYGLESLVTWTLTPDGYGDAPAHGTVRLPARPATGLPGRKARVAAVLWDAGAGRGADRLKSAGASKLSPIKQGEKAGPRALP